MVKHRAKRVHVRPYTKRVNGKPVRVSRHTRGWPPGSPYGGATVTHHQAERIHSGRSERSRLADESRRAHEAETYEDWATDPRRSDIEGLDTPSLTVRGYSRRIEEVQKAKERKKSKSKPKPSAKAESTAERLSHYTPTNIDNFSEDAHAGIGGREFVVTKKTVTNPRNRTMAVTGEFVVIVRKKDAKQFLIRKEKLEEGGVSTTPGTRFNARTTYNERETKELTLSERKEK